MSWHVTQEHDRQLKASTNHRAIDFLSKPIIIYNFIDLTCSKCWTLEPYIKKLLLEYGMFFTVRPIIYHDSIHLIKRNSIKLNKGHEDTTANPLIGVKAAGLQGNKVGRCFLRKVQEAHFLEQKNIYDFRVLIQCAKQAGLDIAEFKSDLHSLSAHKAFQCDIKIADEMNVNQLPTLVFFSQIIEDHTVKISGVQSYTTYVYLLKEMLQKDPLPAEKPPLKKFLQHYKVVDINEVAIVYDWTIEEATLKLKELQLMQKVKQINKNGHIFWAYN